MYHDTLEFASIESEATDPVIIISKVSESFATIFRQMQSKFITREIKVKK